MKLKKKLLLISESMGGGLRKHIVQLIEHLDSEKFDVYFIHGTTTMDEVFAEKYEELKKKATIIPCESFKREINPKFDILTFNFLKEKMDEIKPDIVHCHSSKAGAIGRVAAKLSKVDCIFYTPHAYSFLSKEFSPFKKNIFILTERILSKKATTKTFCVSEGEKEAALENKIDIDDKISVIYNGLPTIDLPEKGNSKTMLGLCEDDIVIGNNARLTKQKNPMLFLEIASNMIKINKKFHFVWVGDGPLAEESKLFIKEQGVSNNIHFLGERKDSELIVSAYDVFLSTSLYEGLPYAPIEAMRAGVPVLASNVVGNIEIVEKSITGELFDLDSCKEQIQKKLHTTLNLNSNNIQKVFEEKFSISKMIDRIVLEYDK